MAHRISRRCWTQWLGRGLAALGCWAALAPSGARAVTHALAPSLIPEALSESVPTAFAPADFSVEDFALDWKGGRAPEGTRARLIPNSLQWVRVADVLVIPRARLELVADAGATGRATTGGYSQALAGGKLELPVALLSGEANPVEVAVESAGRRETAVLLVRFAPRPQHAQAPRAFVDPSCSRFGVSAAFPREAGPGHWAYLGCRLVSVEGEDRRLPSLELFALWDGVGQSARVGGAETAAASVSVWPLRLRTQPGHAQLEAAGHELRIGYRLPQTYHYAFLGAGIGPYTYQFNGFGETENRTIPLLTLYGSYFITETTRLVAFDATAFTEQFYTDFGVYVSTESLKILDRRVTMNLMLGMHVIGFRSRGQYYMKPGAPQGIELIATDVFKRAHNLTLGGFVYPEINGKEYYNVWVRWGSGALFGELNYISWKEIVNDRGFFSRAFGITVGMPLARFL
jgi:hypothetical protein